MSPPVASTAHHQIAILMGTLNGATFLGDQVQSIAQQSHDNWTLIASDDGSTDETCEILRRFSQEHPQRVAVRNGPRKGASANFLSLAANSTIKADFFAFADQDDIWHADKLQRALDWIVTVPEDIPGLYCSRTELMSSDGRCYGLSRLFKHPPAFQNALVQSLGGGNTMVFNRATKALLERVGRLDVVLHDWWLYQLVSAVGGRIHYDPQPTLKYRQHRDNLVGSNLGWRAKLRRIRMMLGGRLHDWNATNIAALRSIPAELIEPQNRSVLVLFAQATTAPALRRLKYFIRSGVYRQTRLSHLSLIAAAVIKKI